MKNSLHIRSDTKEAFVPIEDISSVVLASRQINLSVDVLNRLGSHHVNLIVTNDKHLPSGILIPYGSYHRPLQTTDLQIGMTAPFKKITWKKIIEQKIKNQHDHLAQRGSQVSLYDLLTSIRSGDPDNREAQAAKRYWKELLGATGRKTEMAENSGLDYGYAIVRSSLARNIASYGLLGHLGVHHRGPYNAFNLADDLIEPFRPIIDHFVIEYWSHLGKKLLDTHDKATFQKIFLLKCWINGELSTVSHCSERIVSSFVRALQSKKPSALEMPGFFNE